jgi:hypothetical protein
VVSESIGRDDLEMEWSVCSRGAGFKSKLFDPVGVSVVCGYRFTDTDVTGGQDVDVHGVRACGEDGVGSLAEGVINKAGRAALDGLAIPEAHLFVFHHIFCGRE